MKATPGTLCYFRRWISDGTIIAIFPQQVGSRYGFCKCYQPASTRGSECDPKAIVPFTKPAKPDEYAALAAELRAEPFNYDLVIVDKPRHYEYWWRIKELMAEYMRNG